MIRLKLQGWTHIQDSARVADELQRLYDVWASAEPLVSVPLDEINDCSLLVVRQYLLSAMNPHASEEDSGASPEPGTYASILRSGPPSVPCARRQPVEAHGPHVYLSGGACRNDDTRSEATHLYPELGPRF